jgi:hypothetical protein
MAISRLCSVEIEEKAEGCNEQQDDAMQTPVPEGCFVSFAALTASE